VKLADIKNPVGTLPGAGPSAVKLFAKLNIFTVADLLQFYPKEYDDRTERRPLSAFASGKVHTAAQITAHEWFGYGKMHTLKLIVSDDSASAVLIAFNRPFLEKAFPVGSVISLTGTFSIRYGELQSSSFEAVKLADNGTTDEFSGPLPDSGILPVYPLTEGLNQKNVRKTITAALNQYGAFIDNELPAPLIADRKLLSKQQAIRSIHEPAKADDVAAARHTLIYEELFHFQCALAQRAWNHRGTLPDVSLTLPEQQLNTAAETNEKAFKSSLSPLQQQLLERLPFPLTGDQKRVITEMNSDLDRGYCERNNLLNAIDEAAKTGKIPAAPQHPVFTMSRLLQGDVGSGKTLVALFVCLRVISWKGQCALMAPTEILARQHAETAAQLLEPLGIHVAFLTGNVKTAGRTQLLKALKDGLIDIIIGTHALFSPQVQYNDLELAVIDEQHRFGVLQRQAIIEKGRRITGTSSYTLHLLMMSATPIPQTLALTVFGDLDMSVLHTMPAGRKPVITYLVREGHETNAYEAVRKELRNGHQAYFVYPAIDSTKGGETDSTLKSAEEMFAFLSQNVYSEFKCALVHSRIDETEQEKILSDFRSGSIRILAATTVIEVGVDVPNATCIVIEQADRFGLAQLHQLRGRVGRSSAQSYCFLVYGKDITETGVERMKVLRQSTDGFYIAEQDLKLRGPGEVTGTIQAGNLSLGIADIVRDHDVLLQARADAFTYMKNKL
jgi:ATP-dependent DNA helicase RecG